MRAQELRPDIASLFTADRELEYVAPSATARGLTKEGMAAGLGLRAGSAKLSLRQQFGTPC